MNNETRWNSTYMMIERALRKQTDIRAFIFATQEEEDGARRIPAEDILSSEDWRVLGEVNEILKPIYLQTMRTQGWGKGDSHGRLWEVLIGMEYLLEHFEDWNVLHPIECKWTVVHTPYAMYTMLTQKSMRHPFWSGKMPLKAEKISTIIAVTII
jgi:hypothetical protein